MTLDLKPIKERLDAATPGPWWDESGVVHAKAADWTEQLHNCCHPLNNPSPEDIAIIVLLRNIAPALIAEVERLRLKVRLIDRLPFCPDHRDKVVGKPCRECEVEALRAAAKAKGMDGANRAFLKAAANKGLEVESHRISEAAAKEAKA